MSCERFTISEQNPNDQIGGGGCVCSPTKTDCKGPYAIFYACETDSGVSPHVVLSLACAEAFVRRAASEDALSLTPDTIDSTAVEDDAPAADTTPPRRENPSFTDDELLDRLADHDEDDVPEL